MNEAVERAFGSNMKTITQSFPPTINTEEDYNKYWLEILSDFYYTNMKPPRAGAHPAGMIILGTRRSERSDPNGKIKVPPEVVK
jgi:hypothetical protein